MRYLDPRVLENLDWFDGYNHYVAMGTLHIISNLTLNIKMIGWEPRICNWFKLSDTTVDAITSGSSKCISY